MSGRAIETRDAKIPPPTADLFVQMARAGYEASCQHGQDSIEHATPFDQLSVDAQERWLFVARAMYSVVALRGGASVRSLG